MAVERCQLIIAVKIAMNPKVRVLVPIWGKRYIKQFIDLALPSFLAPGNLPALEEATNLEMVILVSATSYLDFDKYRRFLLCARSRHIDSFRLTM